MSIWWRCSTNIDLEKILYSRRPKNVFIETMASYLSSRVQSQSLIAYSIIIIFFLQVDKKSTEATIMQMSVFLHWIYPNEM